MLISYVILYINNTAVRKTSKTIHYYTVKEVYYFILHGNIRDCAFTFWRTNLFGLQYTDIITVIYTVYIENERLRGSSYTLNVQINAVKVF